MPSFVAENVALVILTFLACRHGFLHDNFFVSLDPCVVAVSRVLLELIFVRNGSLGLSSDFIDVDSVINFLCTSCTIP